MRNPKPKQWLAAQPHLEVLLHNIVVGLTPDEDDPSEHTPWHELHLAEIALSIIERGEL